MSWQASAWAKGQKTGSPSKKAVLLCLGETTDQWGFAWAGGAVIAVEAELSLRQVRTLIRELAEQELITIFQGRGKDGVKVNLYRLNFAAKPKDPVPDDHPSLSGRYKHYRGPENLPDLGAVLSGGPGAKCDKATGSGASSLVQPTALKPTRTENNRKTRARGRRP
jgi:hypothetical protein